MPATPHTLNDVYDLVVANNTLLTNLATQVALCQSMSAAAQVQSELAAQSLDLLRKNWQV